MANPTDDQGRIEAHQDQRTELAAMGAQLARTAILQAFSNGEVPRAGGPVSNRLLVVFALGAGLGDMQASVGELNHVIRRALPQDPHYAGTDAEGRAVIAPVPGERIGLEPWLYSIIRGSAVSPSQARCREAWGAVYEYGRVVFPALVGVGSFRMKQVNELLQHAGLTLTEDQRRAFIEYLHAEEVFKPLGTGTYEIRGDIAVLAAQLQRPERVDDLRDITELAVSSLRGRGVIAVDTSVILERLKSAGVQPRHFQRAELLSYLRMSPKLRSVSTDNKTFCFA
jgi:hypothetical protein